MNDRIETHAAKLGPMSGAELLEALERLKAQQGVNNFVIEVFHKDENGELVTPDNGEYVFEWRNFCYFTQEEAFKVLDCLLTNFVNDKILLAKDSPMFANSGASEKDVSTAVASTAFLTIERILNGKGLPSDEDYRRLFRRLANSPSQSAAN